MTVNVEIFVYANVKLLESLKLSVWDMKLVYGTCKCKRYSFIKSLLLENSIINFIVFCLFGND